MNEQQRQAFEAEITKEGYGTNRNVDGTYLDQRVDLAWWGYKTALAQREPSHVEGNDISAERVDKTDQNRHELVAYGEVAALVSQLRLHHKHEILDWDIYLMAATLLERTEATRMAAVQESQEAHAEMETQCRLAGEYSADNARLKNDLVAALAELGVKQTEIMAMEKYWPHPNGFGGGMMGDK